jgi:hypothetical protein
MWHTECGERVLTKSEWDLFGIGLKVLLGVLEDEIAGEYGQTDFEIGVFDRLTPEQKIVVLADVAFALRETSVESPITATHDAALVAVFKVIERILAKEVVMDEPGQTLFRRLVLTAAADAQDDGFEARPQSTSNVWSDWADHLEGIAGRLIADDDYAREDEFLDLPPETVEVQMSAMGIPRYYFLYIPDEPRPNELAEARQTLRLLLSKHD